MTEYITDKGQHRRYTDPIRVIELSVPDQVGSGLGNIDAVRNLYTDVIVIRNFLNPSEISTVLQQLFNDEANTPPFLKNSKTYPFSFASLDRSAPEFDQHLRQYFSDAKAFRNQFAASFGIDVERRFTDILTRLNNGHRARILDVDDYGSYLPFTIRIILPEKNHINLHCDNMFSGFAPEFYGLLSDVAEVKNQLSFFTVLQAPEHGGQLSIFNVTWDVAKQFNIEEQSIILDDGRRLYAGRPEELYRAQIELREGDLVVFAGGQMYHRIEEVYGARMRVTMGGFIGFSKSNKDIYYWS